MLLVVDNGSVFTPNILDTLSKKNIKFSLVSFKKINELDWKKFNSFILSGRRKNEKKMNAINSEIINHVVSEKRTICFVRLKAFFTENDNLDWRTENPSSQPIQSENHIRKAINLIITKSQIQNQNPGLNTPAPVQSLSPCPIVL